MYLRRGEGVKNPQNTVYVVDERSLMRWVFYLRRQTTDTFFWVPYIFFYNKNVFVIGYHYFYKKIFSIYIRQSRQRLKEQ